MLLETVLAQRYPYITAPSFFGQIWVVLREPQPRQYLQELGKAMADNTYVLCI